MRRFSSLQRKILAVVWMMTGLGLSAQNEAEPELAPATVPEDLPDPVAEPLPTAEEPVPVREEVRLMQEIEPNFMPKDDRAIQLFMLQKVVSDNDAAIKAKKEQASSVRALFSQKFRDDVAKYGQSKISDIEKLYESSQEDLIKYYEIAIKNNPNHKIFTPDALYYLGLYYFEIDEKDYFDKLALYSAAKEQGRDDVSYPDENFTRTLEVYERLIKDYSDYRHIDSVYYLLALAMWYEGDFYGAVDKFQALIKQFPASKYVDEVWFRLGEYFYDNDDYDDAVDAYAKVIKNTKSPLYDKAVYKTAWAHFQKDRYDQAIDHFIKIVELTEDEKVEGSSGGMRAEVIRYIVKSFSEKLLLGEEKIKVKKASVDEEKEYAEQVGRKLAEKIIAHFTSNAKPPAYFREILLEIATQLLDESKSDGAILALRQVVKLDPKHKDNPRFDSQIVDILQEANRLEEARLENHNLVKRYSKRSRWYKAMEGNFEAQGFAREAVRDAMLALAVFYHKTGKDFKEAGDKPNADANFKKAASLYSSYVREYPEREDTTKAVFYFAESAYELNRFRAALDAYQLLKEYPLPMPDNIRRDATFNIVFTFRSVLESEAKKGRFKEIDFDALTSKQRGLEKIEIPKLGLKYLSAIDDFLRLAPTDEQVPVLLFHAAAIYYVYGNSDESLSRFYYIIDTYPATAAATVAGRLVIDDSVSKEDWNRVAELAKRFRDQNLGGQQGDFARIEGNARFKIARAVFEQANDFQKNNQLAEAKAKYKESAELFDGLLKEDPNNPYADIMLFNSARAVVQSGTTTAALPLYRKLYTSYPNSEYAKPARFQEALALEKMLKFGDAAKAYDGIIKDDPKSEAAGDAMLNKALLYEAAGDLPNAIESFVAFAKRYPERPEAPDALLASAAMYKRTGKVNQQIAMLEQFIKQYRKDADKVPAVIEAYVHIGDTYGDLAKSAQAPAAVKKHEKAQLDNYRSALSLYSAELGSPIAAFYAAKAQLFLQKPEQDAFKKLSINARDGKTQGEQLTAMMKSLADLSAKNEGIIKAYAQPVWNAESMYRIGVLYEHLARTMVKAPCPRDVAAVDEYACDEYMVLLEDKSAVLEEKALSAYQQAYEIGMSAYDAPPELVDRVQVALNRLKPGKYQRVGNVVEKPLWGAYYGQGRMLSTGRMASGLHKQEVDPDIKKAAEPEPEVVPESTPEVEATPEPEENIDAGEEEDLENADEDFE